jgi:glucose-1-phosphate adenylyltransferase
MPSLENILAIVLGGGAGSRLFPLTQQRSKPAVPIAGKYRLIDIPISNCINSGIYRIAVLTQFNSVSLHRHISHTYNFDAFHRGWVQIWAAEQTFRNSDWYQGTADAVRKQMSEILSARADWVLVLAGDHLYRMDYAAMARFHWETDADITIAVQPVAVQDSVRFGILKRDESLRIVQFAEKPSDPQLLADLVSRDDPQRPFLGSMGIYLFNTRVLVDLLESTTFQDFGKNVIPYAIGEYNVAGFDFDDYWEDIGTIRSFYDTNLALTDPDTRFNLFDPEKPIYTNPRFLPGTIVENSILEKVLLAEGCYIKNSEIRHSVVGLRSQIQNGVKIFDSILMGADYYQRSSPTGSPSSDIPIGIGVNSHISGAIIDKNARVGNDVIIKPFLPHIDLDGDNWVVRDGIVVIPKNAILPPGTIISPESV